MLECFVEKPSDREFERMKIEELKYVVSFKFLICSYERLVIGSLKIRMIGWLLRLQPKLHRLGKKHLRRRW